MSKEMEMLPPHMPADMYRITGSLRDVGAWRAVVQAGNSMSEDMHVGDWDEVGYVMVAVVGEPRFVPIARSDEHQQGYELMCQNAKRWKLDPREFFPVFHGGKVGIYLYDEDDMPRALEALRRWHAAGGPEVSVRWSSGSKESRWMLSSIDFVKSSGQPQPDENGLLPIGARLVSRLRTLALAVSALRSPDQPWTTVGQGGNVRMRRAAEALCRYLAQYRDIAFEGLWDVRRKRLYVNGTLDEALEAWTAQVDAFVAQEDIDGLCRLVFSHNGLKNRLHMAIRREMRDKRSVDCMRLMFGDLESADAAMAAVNPGIEPENDVPEDIYTSEATAPSPRM